METIYTGKENLLADKLIERTIKEHNVNVFKITQIRVECYMPRDTGPKLWEISISINYDIKSYYYSKDCIEHGYTLTYLEHLKRMGVKKINLRRLNRNG
jgi:hypothetical protein